jgi:hypothetical protein
MSFKITFTDASAFVLIARNKENSRFYARPKADIIKEMENGAGYQVFSQMAEGVYEESKIIDMIGKGTDFFTHEGKEFTPVTIVDGNLRSIKNGTTKDNINELSIAEICN